MFGFGKKDEKKEVFPLTPAEFNLYKELAQKKKDGKITEPENILLEKMFNDLEALDIKRKAEELADKRKDLANKSTGHLWDNWFEKKVRIVSIERNGSHIRILEVPWRFDGIIVDKFWGKAAEIASDIRPVEITIGRDTRTGFLVDGDKGCGVNLERDQSSTIDVINPKTGNVEKTSLVKLKATAGLMFNIVDSKKLGEAYSTDVTGRTKIMYFVIGGLVFLILFGGMI